MNELDPIILSTIIPSIITGIFGLAIALIQIFLKPNKQNSEVNNDQNSSKVAKSNENEYLRSKKRTNARKLTLIFSLLGCFFLGLTIGIQWEKLIGNNTDSDLWVGKWEYSESIREGQIHNGVLYLFKRGNRIIGASDNSQEGITLLDAYAKKDNLIGHWFNYKSKQNGTFKWSLNTDKFFTGNYAIGAKNVDQSRNYWNGNKATWSYHDLVLFGKKVGGNNYQLALKFYDEALNINPIGSKALNYKGYAHLKLGKLNEAHKALSKAKSLYPEDIWIIYNYSKVLWSQGKTEEALMEVTVALQKDRELIESYIENDISNRDWVGTQNQLEMLRGL